MNKKLNRPVLLTLVALLGAASFLLTPESNDRGSEVQMAAAGRYHTYKRRGALYDQSRANRPSRGLYTVGR